MMLLRIHYQASDMELRNDEATGSDVVTTVNYHSSGSL